MTKRQEDILKIYADKKETLAQLASEVKSLEPKVLNLLEKQGIETLKETYGTFSVVYRKKWTYSEEYSEKELQYEVTLKSMRDEEQKNGTAKAEETKGVTYRKYEVQEK